jgi:chaperonin GroES
MSIGITPLGDYVLAQQEQAKSKTASGLFLPEKATEKPKIATVLAVGGAVSEVKIGDKIVFGGYSNNELKHDGVDYILIKVENIYAIIK